MVGTLVMAAVLHGKVTLGPLRPVCQATMPCEGPAVGVVLTFRHAGRLWRVKTDGHGVYRVSLPAGRYLVSASRGIRLAPSSVIVLPGTHTRGFAIDTGIR